jgi:hypothetical protein
MGAEKTEMDLAKELANTQLTQMQAPLVFNIIPDPVKSPLVKIPFLSRFIKSATATNNAARQLHTLSSVPSPRLLAGMQFGGLSLAAIDFFLVPMVYLYAYISGQKVPINLNNNARWAFAALAFSLTLASILVPGVAPILGLVGAGLGLGASCFLLGKTLYKRYQLGKEKRAIEGDIERAEKEMQEIQHRANALQLELKDSKSDAKAYDMLREVAILGEDYTRQKTRFEALKKTEVELNIKIKKLGTIHVLDRGLGVAFAALALAGVVVSVFFPPIGLGILAAVSAVSIVYVAARLISPLILPVKNWILSKSKPSVMHSNPGEGKADSSTTKPPVTNSAAMQQALGGNLLDDTADNTPSSSADLAESQNVAKPIVDDTQHRAPHIAKIP